MATTSVPLTETSISLRCPKGSQRLLAVLKKSGDFGAIPPENSLKLELACRDCKTRIYNETGIKPLRVLHRYTLLGVLTESEVVPR